MGLFQSLLIGLVAGVITGWTMRGRSLSCLWNITIGMLGGPIGSWTYGPLGVATGDSWWAQLICAVMGACVVLLAVGLFSKRKKQPPF